MNDRVGSTAWRRRLMIVIATPVMLYLVALASDYVRYWDIVASKEGRVVDAVTGAGVAGVTVIVRYTAVSYGLDGIGTACTSQKMLVTDDEGRYVIPFAWKGSAVGSGFLFRALTFKDPMPRYVVAFYKDGWLDQAWDDMQTRAASGDRRAGWRYPNSRPMRITYTIPDLPMTFAASAGQRSRYVEYLTSLARALPCGDSPDGDGAEFETLLASIKASARSTVCALPADVTAPRMIALLGCATIAGMRHIPRKDGANDEITAGQLCASFDHVPVGYECGGFPSARVVIPDYRETAAAMRQRRDAAAARRQNSGSVAPQKGAAGRTSSDSRDEP